jgi:hypothetical protein
MNGTDIASQRRDYHDVLSRRLLRLRPLLSEAREPSYLDLFDDFVRAHEFGLALETLCDYLRLESPCRPLSGDDLQQIEALHQLMQVANNCVSALRQKSVAR